MRCSHLLVLGRRDFIDYSKVQAMKQPLEAGSRVVYLPSPCNRVGLKLWAVSMIGEVCTVTEVYTHHITLMAKQGERLVRIENVQPYPGYCINCRLEE